MSRTSNTKRYYEIARDCLRSAQHADNPATRDKLLDQAQVWMDAAMRETFIATIGAGDESSWIRTAGLSAGNGRQGSMKLARSAAGRLRIRSINIAANLGRSGAESRNSVST